MSFFDSVLKAVPLVGDLIGARSQRKANEQNYENQKEFAQNGIRWRVEDAKQAGLHPLFALGGAGATYSPSAQPVFDSGSLGQNLSRAASAFSTPEEKQLKALQIEAVRAATAKDYAQAAAFESEAARTRQQSLPSVPNPADVAWFDAKGMGNPWVAQSYPVSGFGDTAKPLDPVNPPYLAGGAEPGFKRFNVPGLGEVILPNASSASEAIEALENPVIQAAVAAANVAHYGESGLGRVRKLAGKWWSDPLGAGVDYLRRQLPPGVYRESR